jgi:hypothetical protein
VTAHDDAGVVLPGNGRVFWTGRSQAQVKIEFADDRTFVMFEASPPPGVPGPPQHVHREYDEAWYILQGEVEFDLGAHTHWCYSHGRAGSVRFTRGCARSPGPWCWPPSRSPP